MNGLAFEPALFDDYLRWAKAYVQKGGKFTHFTDHPWDNTDGRFTVALQNFTLSGGYGANRIDVIIPDGVEFMGGDIGHCALYDMNTSDVIADGPSSAYVPLYDEPELLKLKGAAEFAEAARVRYAERDAQRQAEERAREREQERFRKYNPIGQYLDAFEQLRSGYLEGVHE